MKVFISHTFIDEDQPLALTLQKILAEENIEGYLAEKKKEYDLLIRDKIQNEIKNSDHMVAIVTNKARESSSVNQELGYAIRDGIKPIIMIEENAKGGVLTHGIEPEEFTRNNFEQHCIKVRSFILKKGIRIKISDEDKKALIENVYRPCYNTIMNIYNKREFITEIPDNPWNKLEHYWKLKAEKEIRELFIIYEKERQIWHEMWVDFGNKFQTNQKNIGAIATPVFEKFHKLDENGNVRLSEKSYIEPGGFLSNFRDVIFNDDIHNHEDFYQMLLDFANRKVSGLVWLLEKWKKDTPQLYHEILNLVPDMTKELNAKYSYHQIDQQRSVLKELIEKLTISLEEKLK